MTLAGKPGLGMNITIDSRGESIAEEGINYFAIAFWSFKFLQGMSLKPNHLTLYVPARLSWVAFLQEKNTGWRFDNWALFEGPAVNT